MTIETLNPAQATEIMRAAGLKMTPETLRLGLKQGAFPFGTYIDRDGTPVCTIYRKLLDRWMEGRASA